MLLRKKYDPKEKDMETIRFMSIIQLRIVDWNYLVPIFETLCKEFDNIHLRRIIQVLRFMVGHNVMKLIVVYLKQSKHILT